MQAELITIGDEILIGQTIDTNSAWMGKELNSLGIQVSQITSIKDERDAIKNALFAAEQSAANLVFITGGLGPTKDDITKHVLCEYFNTVLIRDNEVLNRIQTFFKARGREMLESNNQQADVPEACTVLLNDMGTASGMWFERNGTVFVSMPGVPYEMKHLMQDRVLPKIQELFKLPAVFHKTIMTTGIGESFLVEIIKDWETSLITEDIKIAYLPSPGIVRIRLTGQGDDLAPLQEKVLRKAKELYSLIPQHIFGEDDISMEEALGNLLKEKGQTIATAESCTGGYIAHLLTNRQGSSAFYLGGFVSYDNQVKIEVLRVDKDSIEEEGAVSETVVKQMANGARNLLKTDLAIATSGVAGPDGGTDEKPVGTVWIAIASSKGVIAKKFLFEKNRDRNIRRTALAAMSMVREVL
ncbi:MAG: nicotinamide-nucleotide amidase [Vicingaceae bacterium]|jgi:nicotinamide-nucleotide amidase